jgi:hypothetical protein
MSSQFNVRPRRFPLFWTAVILIILALFAFFSSNNNLHCTRDKLDVIRVSCGRKNKIISYPEFEVKQIQFGVVTYSRYGGIGGLIFTSSGKRIKLLRGLKCVEAQKILDELQRLGYEIVRDAGMPMMVEMELSRRKSLLGSISGSAQESEKCFVLRGF